MAEIARVQTARRQPNQRWVAW